MQEMAPQKESDESIKVLALNSVKKDAIEA